MSSKRKERGRILPAHGFAGLAIILIAEAMLFDGNSLVGHWFTPIVWTGFILFMDALVDKISGRSLLTIDRIEFLIIAVVSIAGWWLFEFYNAPRFWRSDLELWWHYHNLEPNPYLRRAGYDWAFATIFPALFLAAQFFASTIFKNQKRLRPIKLSKPVIYIFIFAGALGALIPLFIINEWLVPLVWLAYIFLLDPVNALRGWPSITGDLARGQYTRLFALLASGFLCGFLWEFWNYYALSKWTYTVPYLGNIKLFEMPVLGFFGFPPFVVECWAIYIFCRSLLGGKHFADRMNDTDIWIPSNSNE